ncbi:MAG: hypothetical protein JSS93_13635 [Bacteroidetes bacterium]|nr:hypothetical protein [Bacteroidota bacterium]
MGVGIFNQSLYFDAGGVYNPSSFTNMGFYPRIGFDFHYLSFIFDYNLVPDTTAMLYPSGSPGPVTFINNYLSVRLGAMIGGRRKK